MGLDMYLHKRTYVSKWDRWNIKSLALEATENPGYIKKINPERVSYIVEEVAYWRKANQIHKWFVNNIQKGVDDCGDYNVDYEQLRELYNICIMIRDKKGDPESLLPVQPGFFFGNTDYDEYYMDDINNTIYQLESIFKEDPEGQDQYFYHASW